MATDLILVSAATLLLVAILASKASAKLGIPSLLVFLGIGMLAGSDGPGGIAFDNVALANVFGSLALAFILFSGGLETTWSTIRPILWRGVALSTLGVVITCGAIGLFAHYALGLPIYASLLLGAAASTTDAAAVFGVLRSRQVHLKHRITPLLEFESGSNDAVAVFLVTTLISMAKNPGGSLLDNLPSLIFQLPIGFAIGLVGSLGTVWLINHLRLEYDGLYSVLTIASACFIFGSAHLLGGNAFLAVYVAGVVMGSANYLHKIALKQFHEAVAWLMQIAMFVMLGLLVYPSRLPGVIVPGLLLSAFLILVARPAAVFGSLAFARLGKRSKFFVSWAGLRGAVPIILATFPLMAGVPDAQHIFDLVFFVVLTSVAIQGTTMGQMAKWLNVRSQQSTEPMDLTRAEQEDMLEVLLQSSSPVVGKQVVDLRLPTTALLVLLKRNGDSYIPRGATILKSGDRILIATRRQDHDELRARFEGQ